ncbi:MAG: hypothetical protein AAFR64_06170, partial [Pseudomonadota bacterium]
RLLPVFCAGDLKKQFERFPMKHITFALAVSASALVASGALAATKILDDSVYGAASVMRDPSFELASPSCANAGVETAAQSAAASSSFFIHASPEMKSWWEVTASRGINLNQAQMDE